VVVPVSFVGGMAVSVVDVVDMVAVGDGDMPATVTMNMGVVGVLGVRSAHGCSSWECRMASLTM
jgi:hypothetical protein